MEIKEYMYKGKVVEFFFNEDIMVNATEMAAVFDRRVAKFLELQSTKIWIKWLENNAIRANRSPSDGLRSSANALLGGEIKHRSPDLVPILIVEKGGDSGGTTWMHRLLAIDFAMWLDIDFKGWVILKIDQLLLDYSMGHRKIALEKRNLIEELELIFRNNSNDTNIKRIQQIQGELKQLQGDKLNLNKNFNKEIFQSE